MNGARNNGITLLAAALSDGAADQHHSGRSWASDNGNGTYSNPLFYDEFYDPDMIRGGEQRLAGSGRRRFNERNQNSMINRGPVVLNWGNNCFTYIPAFSLGNNGTNVWNNQRLMAASAALAKDVPLKGERVRLRLRLDFQNPFEWYNWGGPNMANAVAHSLLNRQRSGTKGEQNTNKQRKQSRPVTWRNIRSERWSRRS